MFPGVRGAGPDWSCGRPTTGHPSPAPGEATSSPVQSSLETESSVWRLRVQSGVSALTARWSGESGPVGTTDSTVSSVTLTCVKAVSTGRLNVPHWLGIFWRHLFFWLSKQTYIIYHLDERVELRKLGKSVLGLEEEQRRNRQSWLFPPTAPVIEEEEPPPSYQQAVTASPLPVWILQFYE